MIVTTIPKADPVAREQLLIRELLQASEQVQLAYFTACQVGDLGIARELRELGGQLTVTLSRALAVCS